MVLRLATDFTCLIKSATQLWFAATPITPMDSFGATADVIESSDDEELQDLHNEFF